MDNPIEKVASGVNMVTAGTSAPVFTTFYDPKKSYWVAGNARCVSTHENVPLQMGLLNEAYTVNGWPALYLRFDADTLQVQVIGQAQDDVDTIMVWSLLSCA